MNKQQSRNFILLKWSFIIFLLLIIFGLIYLGFLYYEIQQNKTKGYANAKETVIKNTSITEINNIVRFHGEEAYYVIYGTTESKKELMAFVPFNHQNNDQLTVLDLTEIISKESVIEEWQKQCTDCQLIKVIPGMINNKPLWEITYVDSSKRYVFDYLSIEDGSQYERLRFKRMFN